MALRNSKTNQSKNKCAEDLKSMINPEWLKNLDETKPDGKKPATNEELDFIRMAVKKGLTTKSIAKCMNLKINRVKYLRSIV